VYQSKTKKRSRDLQDFVLALKKEFCDF